MTYDEITKQIRDQGHRLTTARKEVIRILCENRNYLGAYDIHHLVENQGNHIGVASIYRILAMLESQGYLQREEFGSGGERFRLPEDNLHHAHQLICSKCGDAQEFADCPIASIAKTLESQSGYQIQEHWLRFFGLCPKCRV